MLRQRSPTDPLSRISFREDEIGLSRGRNILRQGVDDDE
jgi:hypothetical protein